MSIQWEIIESGPADAAQTILFLPGGMMSARSWSEVTSEPVLSSYRKIAVTMPGMAGTPAPDDCTAANYARLTAELVKRYDVDVVVGFSMGAQAAYEMAVAGLFKGPLVLLGLSLSAPDEPAAFRAMIAAGSVLGTLPSKLMRKGVASMVRNSKALSPERAAELADDMLLNKPRDMRASLGEYGKWLKSDEDRAQMLVDTGVPTWVVHAEKGDGKLTAHERAVFEAAPHVKVVTIPGSVFFLPNEIPEQCADFTAQALALSAKGR